MSENICAVCGCTSEELLTVTNASGDEVLMCEHCVDEAKARGDIHVCDQCGSLVVEVREVVTDYSWRNGEETEMWCSECVNDDTHTCSECGRLVSDYVIEEHLLYSGRWVQICNGCFDNHYFECPDCEYLCHSEDGEYGTDGERYCPDCVGSHLHGDNLQGYGHTSGINFRMDDGTSKLRWEMSEEELKAMYLGIELETDGNDDANDLADDINYAYDDRYVECKEDGSLNDEGVEIVSQPMTPKYHLTSGMWEEIADIVRRHGGTSHDAGSCGLHIHISRAFFEDDAVYRLDRLFHRFRSQLLRFSRRSDYQLRWCNLEEEDELAEIPDIEDRKEEWKSKKRFAGRYEAVNNTNPSTVEIRLWRGTLNMVTFKATVQLTAGLAYIVNTMEDRLADSLTWSGVKTLVRYALEAEGIGHEELDQYLESRGL